MNPRVFTTMEKDGAEDARRGHRRLRARRVRGTGRSGPDVNVGGTPQPQLTPDPVPPSDVRVDATGFRDERISNVDRTADPSCCCATWGGGGTGSPSPQTTQKGPKRQSTRRLDPRTACALERSTRLSWNRAARRCPASATCRSSSAMRDVAGSSRFGSAMPASGSASAGWAWAVVVPSRQWQGIGPTRASFSPDIPA